MRPEGGAFRSLRVPSFQRFLTAQLVMMCGTWMHGVAQAWLVLNVSDDSALAVGVITALGALPVLLFGAWGGVIVDRFPTRSVLMLAQGMLATSASGLALVTWTNTATLVNIGALVILAGFANMMLLPAGQAFVNEMVEREDLPNAIALNASAVNGSRVVGPALAGVVILTVGTGACFFINALAFVTAMTLLRSIRADQLRPTTRVARARGQIREGLSYMWAHPDIRSNLILTAIVGLFAYNFPVVLPIMAKQVFHGGAGLYSLMNVAAGAGALVGGVLVASRATATPRQLVLAVTVLAAVTCATAAAPNLLVLFLLLGLTGACNVGVIATSNAMLQLTAAESMRGRVLAIRAITVIGGMAIGGPITGAVTNGLGPRWGLAVGGAVTFGAAGWYALFVRRQAGLPDLLAGVGATPAPVAPET